MRMEICWFKFYFQTYNIHRDSEYNARSLLVEDFYPVTFILLQIKCLRFRLWVDANLKTN